jgi:hypothetical protein
MAASSGNIAQRLVAQGRLSRLSACVWFGLLLCIATSAPALRAQLSPSHDKKEEHVSGVVINAVTREPLGRVLVFSPDNRYAMLTDDRGHFAFTFPMPAPLANDGAVRASDGEAALLQLAAKKVGYLSVTDDPGFRSIQPGQQDMSIELLPEARIVGKVSIRGSEDSERIQVCLYLKTSVRGREHWQSLNTVAARSDGTFRIADLRPGDYKLFTLEHTDRDPLDLRAAGGQEFGYPPAYFSGAEDFSTATVIHLKAGETFDASIVPTRREYYPVKLPVLNAAREGALEVWAQGHPGPGFTLGYDAQQGTIIGSLPNGSYTVRMTLLGPEAMGGTVDFTVAGAAVVGPALAMAPGRSIAVNLREEFQHDARAFNGNGPAPDGTGSVTLGARDYLSLTLEPEDPFASGGAVGLKNRNAGSDDPLATESVLPGSYRVHASTGIGYVAAIRSGGTDLMKQPLQVPAGSDVPAIEVTLRDNGAEVYGTVEQSPQNPSTAVTSTQGAGLGLGATSLVCLVSAEDFTANTQTVWVEPDGRFAMHQIAPGAYYLFAVAHTTSYRRPCGSDDWRKENESKLLSVNLEAGQRAELRAPIVAEE